MEAWRVVAGRAIGRVAASAMTLARDRRSRAEVHGEPSEACAWTIGRVVVERVGGVQRIAPRARWSRVTT